MLKRIIVKLAICQIAPDPQIRAKKKITLLTSYRGIARTFDLVGPNFFRNLWLHAIFVRGWGIVYLINDSTTK